MMLGHQFGGTTAVAAEFDAQSVNATAYAATTKGDLRVAIINKDAAHDLRVKIDPGWPPKPAWVWRLSALALDATTGVTLAGKDVGTAGSWKPVEKDCGPTNTVSSPSTSRAPPAHWCFSYDNLSPVAVAATLGAQPYQPTWESIDKRPTPAWFTDAKFGIFIHWGMYSVPSYAPVLPGQAGLRRVVLERHHAGRDSEANPIQTGTWAFHQRVYGAGYPYQNFAPLFRAELFDPDHWADVFARSGAKYVVLTSKHHEGFALWPSKEASATWGRPWNASRSGRSATCSAI